MREVGNAEIPAVIWAIALVVVGYLFILHQAKAAAARKVQIRKLQRLAAEEVARAEQEEAEEFSSKITRTSGSVFQNRSSSSVIISHPTPVTTAAVSTPHSSPVVKRASFTGSSRASTALGLCAVCSNPTKKQCSRCKRVKYCSQQCQVQHWREWHKHECHESEKRLFSTDAQSNAVLSNLGSSIAKDDDSNINNVFNSSVFFSSQQCQVQHWQEGHKHECHECDESEKQLFSTDAQSNAVLSNLGFSIAKDDDSNINDISFEERLPEAPSKPSRTLETVTTDGSLPKPNKILFPYEHFIELFTWNKLKLVPCGLINCGNSCFASVVLQCLTYTRPLAAYLLEGRHSQECRRNKWCFMCELQHHVSRVRESQIPFSPIRIVSQIRNIGNHLGYGRQEDAHEFTRFAIDSMQSICLDKVGGEKAVDQRTQETTFIHHIFGGHLQSQVRCMQCHHESHKYENMMDLAVEIQGNVETLEDALAQFTAPEWLDGDNKYKCDRCNAYVKAWKRLAIHEAPNILTIALKRFQSGNFGKLNKRVTFPDVLDMSPYMSEEGDKPPHYQLYGVIVHIDMLNASFFGHYICYVKDLHGSWYKIDDSKVKEVDLDKVMQQRAYMLFYTRSGPRCAPIISKGGMQPVEGICVNSCNSKRTTMSNGNHILPELPSVFSNEAANGNGSNFYVSESNGVMLYSEDSDVLTQ